MRRLSIVGFAPETIVLTQKATTGSHSVYRMYVGRGHSWNADERSKTFSVFVYFTPQVNPPHQVTSLMVLSILILQIKQEENAADKRKMRAVNDPPYTYEAEGKQFVSFFGDCATKDKQDYCQRHAKKSAGFDVGDRGLCGR